MPNEAFAIERIGPGFTRWDAVLSLVLAAFDYMGPLIDPPSSALRLTTRSLEEKARDETGFVALSQGRIVGCVFCKREYDCLYVGKLAIDPSLQGRGIGRALIGEAEALARAHGLGALRLQTRIELTANHATFERWGFERTGLSAHDGFERPTTVEMRKALVSEPAA